MTPTTAPTTTAPTTTYPRLPELAPQAAGETLDSFGLRALAFVLAHDCTATLSTEQLQLAAHCYRLAIANRELTASTVDRLAECNRRIAATIRYRAQLQADDAPGLTAAAVGATAPAAGQDRPNLGPMAPLKPKPIKPRGPQTFAPVVCENPF
jgi:hypothetical protein